MEQRGNRNKVTQREVTMRDIERLHFEVLKEAYNEHSLQVCDSETIVKTIQDNGGEMHESMHHGHWA